MINYIMEHKEELLNIVAYVIAIASAVSALTPSTKDDGIIAKIKSFIDVLALNKKK